MRSKYKFQRKIPCLFHIMLLFFSTILCSLLPFNYSQAAKRTIRVGWYDQPCVQEGDDLSSLSGYNYEYLQKLSLYTGWDYEFVYGGWNECEEMLKDGEIDLLGYVCKTPERMNDYNFSEFYAGDFTLYLTTTADNNTYIPGDYESLNQATIGLLSSSAHIGYLQDMAKSFGLSFNYKLFKSAEEYCEALDNHEVDLVLTSDSVSRENQKTIYVFPKQPFYFAVSKNKEDILTELNGAMEEILSSDRKFYSNLYNKYFFSTSNTTKISFSEEEKSFISASRSINVAILDDDYPLSYENEKGQTIGFVHDFLEQISKDSGLSFRYKSYANLDDAIAAMKEGSIDIIPQIPNDFHYSTQHNIYLTQPYLTMQQGLLYKKGSSINSVIIERDSYIDPSLLDGSKYSLKYENELIDCITSIENGSADATFVNYFAYQRILYLHPNAELLFMPRQDATSDFSIGIRATCNPVLYRVLNKAVGNVTPTHIQTMLSASVTMQPDSSFSNWFHNNKRLIVISVLTIIFFILGIILAFLRKLSIMEKEANATLSEKNVELERANAAKSQFLARTSHDLRTPMNAIMGLTALALDETSANKKDFYLGQITTSSEFLLGLINDVLDMDKIENGNIELKPTPYAFSEFCSMINTMIKPLCQNKDIDFTFEKSNFNETIVVDHTRFNQIFFNLLTNAVKYTPNGGSITFSLTYTPADNNMVDLEFIVADTGIGMEEGFMKVMYEPFMQENRDANSQALGSGLGLAIVKNMVDLMNGSIEVTSHLHEGTIFLVKLRVPVTQDAHVEGNFTNPLLIDDTLSGKHILLVDDQPLNLEVAKKILEKKKMIVTIASNGQQAVDIFSSSTYNYFDAILMDIQMPVMNGLDASKAIRNLERADARKIPIIAMTANTFDEDKKKSSEAGMVAHLGKPIVPKELFECLFTYISK